MYELFFILKKALFFFKDRQKKLKKYHFQLPDHNQKGRCTTTGNISPTYKMSHFLNHYFSSYKTYAHTYIHHNQLW